MKMQDQHFYHELAGEIKKLELSPEHKLKLIIHAGTPKTGTTSLQSYFNKNQLKLRNKGILYPHNLQKIQNTSAPRHQWFEKNLVVTHPDFFLENFKNIISQVSAGTHTIILSSEGIYNYWWDFTDQSKTLLEALTKLFNVQVWIWFREPLDFIESYYKQCIRNPQVEGNDCYGKDLSFSQMLDIPWFAQHLDYQGFVDDCRALFGENNVSAFDYNGDIVQQFKEEFGLATPHDNPAPRLNKSFNSMTINLLRVINQQNLKPKDKDKLIPHLKEMSDVFNSYQCPSLIDDDSRERVMSIHKPLL